MTPTEQAKLEQLAERFRNRGTQLFAVAVTVAPTWADEMNKLAEWCAADLEAFAKQTEREP